jgi:hypothetical protein
MQTVQADYFATHRNLKLSRDAKGAGCRVPYRWRRPHHERAISHGIC